MNGSINLFRVIILWLITVIGMILHFNYQVSKLFYGIDIVRNNSLEIPVMAQILKNVYYHFPIIFILIFLFYRNKVIVLSLFVISLFYSVSHVFHLAEEFTKDTFDLGQIPLLLLVLVASMLLNRTSWVYYNELKAANLKEE